MEKLFLKLVTLLLFFALCGFEIECIAANLFTNADVTVDSARRKNVI